MRGSPSPDVTLVQEARSIATSWQLDLDLALLSARQLRRAGITDATDPVDVVAIGKAAGEMASAACAELKDRVERLLVICDQAGASQSPEGAEVMIASHPLPDEQSLRAGDRLVGFLGASTSSTVLFLISGGASSLCVAPAPPLNLVDLHEIFRSSLERGVDITTLNRLRASTSMLGGGAVLGALRGQRSVSLIMVDNVISGPAWVASGLSYDYQPAPDEVRRLIDDCGLAGIDLAERIMTSYEHRAKEFRSGRRDHHTNLVVADPSMMLASVQRAAAARGFEVRTLGADVHDDVEAATRRWMALIAESLAAPGPVCVVGVGEVTLNVRGRGVGGRCQHFALTMASALGEMQFDGDVVFTAISSDGRDFVEGVAGAWVDDTTLARAAEMGVDVADALAGCNSHEALARLGQLITGTHTGWNLCDVYLALVR